MNRLIIAALLASSLATPVLAQGYYQIPPGGGGYGPRGGYDDDRPRRGGGYDDDRPRRGGGYDDRDRGYRRGGYDDDRPRGGGGGGRSGSSTCVTSRGVCPIGTFVPLRTPCRCDIPGFGPKRGAAGG